jgi:hypothetical protein
VDRLLLRDFVLTAGLPTGVIASNTNPRTRTFRFAPAPAERGEAAIRRIREAKGVVIERSRIYSCAHFTLTRAKRVHRSEPQDLKCDDRLCHRSRIDILIAASRVSGSFRGIEGVSLNSGRNGIKTLHSGLVLMVEKHLEGRGGLLETGATAFGEYSVLHTTRNIASSIIRAPTQGSATQQSNKAAE